MATIAPGTLPKNTPLSQLGFTPAAIAKLTPAAKKLTKGDLVALQKWSASGGKGPAPAHLTIADLQSLAKASGTPEAMQARAKKTTVKGGGGTTYCCCCSPCCCCTAAAEIVPVRAI
jgi:hypothetical protein